MHDERIPKATSMLCSQLLSPQWAVVVARMPTLAFTDCAVPARPHLQPKKPFQHGSAAAFKKDEASRAKLSERTVFFAKSRVEDLPAHLYIPVRACGIFLTLRRVLSASQNLVYGCVHQRCIYFYDISLYEIYDANHTSQNFTAFPRTKKGHAGVISSKCKLG